MGMTIQMGNTPKPTCEISLVGNPSFSNGTLTATFNYTLRAMSGASRWGYGVILEYGSSGNLGSEKSLIGTTQRQWSTLTGQIEITKTNVSTSPQTFYFRLNSAVSTGGTPGETYGYEVDFSTGTQPEQPKISKITEISDFTVEYDHWFTFEQYEPSFRNHIWINVRKPGGGDNWETVFSKEDYHTNEKLHFAPEAIATIYRIAMPDTAPGAYVDVEYHLETYRSDCQTFVGVDDKPVKGFITGNVFTKMGETWKNCVPFVNVGGTWKPCVCYQNVNNSWEQTYC